MEKGIAIFSNHGNITLLQTSNDGLYLMFKLHSFSKNQIHAIHIHEYGDISNGCQSLGGHYNPTNEVHGHLKTPRRHIGDLFNNFKTDSNGKFEYCFRIDDIHISDLYGRSFVIHRYADDYGLQNYHLYSNHYLIELCKKLKYNGFQTREERIKKLNLESKINGNAGQRIDCAIIGRCASI
jgi:Cu/Zn superoxide dismutase